MSELRWLPISTYPRDPEPAGPRDDASDDWGPEVLLLMPPCGEYPHGSVAVTGHLEAGMWLSRDAAEPACWGDLAVEPIAWCPLPVASGIDAREGRNAQQSGAEHDSPSA